MVKKIIYAIGLLLLALSPTMTARAVPVCSGSYASTITVSGNLQSVNGTSAAERFIVTGSYNSVKGNGGNDCFEVSGEANGIKGGAGADEIYSAGTRNSLKGEGGADTIYAGVGESVDGGAGTDTCVTDADDSQKNCEL